MKHLRWVAAACLALSAMWTVGGCKGDCQNGVQANGPGKTLITTNCK